VSITSAAAAADRSLAYSGLQRSYLHVARLTNLDHRTSDQASATVSRTYATFLTCHQAIGRSCGVAVNPQPRANVMWKTVLTFALCVVATQLLAQQRPATTAMTCQQARTLVMTQGAVVLSTGNFTYQLYVRDQRYCALAEIAEQGWERTADAAQCPIGFRCRDFGENSSRSGDR
jgi:hypothetical protein